MSPGIPFAGTVGPVEASLARLTLINTAEFDALTGGVLMCTYTGKEVVRCRQVPTVVIDLVRWLRLRALALLLSQLSAVSGVASGPRFIEWTASGQSQQTTDDPQRAPLRVVNFGERLCGWRGETERPQPQNRPAHTCPNSAALMKLFFKGSAHNGCGPISRSSP